MRCGQKRLNRPEDLANAISILSFDDHWLRRPNAPAQSPHCSDLISLIWQEMSRIFHILWSVHQLQENSTWGSWIFCLLPHRHLCSKYENGYYESDRRFRSTVNCIHKTTVPWCGFGMRRGKTHVIRKLPWMILNNVCFTGALGDFCSSCSFSSTPSHSRDELHPTCHRVTHGCRVMGDRRTYSWPQGRRRKVLLRY